MVEISSYPFWKRNLYTMTFAMAMAQMGLSFVFPFMPLFLQQIGIPDHQQAAFWDGLFTTAAAATMAAFAPIWGIMADRFGRKLLVMRAMIGGSIAVGAVALASSPMFVFGFRLLQGAMSGILAPCSALVAAYTPRSRMGYAIL